MVHAIGDRPVIKQGGKHLLHRGTNLLQTHHVQESFLLAGERGIRKILGGGGGTHRDSHLIVTGLKLGIGFFQGVIQNFRKRGVDYPLANLGANPRQFVNVVDIQGIQGFVNAVFQAVGGQEFTVSMSSGSETARDGNTSIGEITDHFTEGGILASNPVYVGHSQVVKPDNVIFQSVSPLSLCSAESRIWRV